MKGEIVFGVLWVLISIAIVNGQNPQITQEILPEVKRLGQTAYLNCTVTRQQLNKVYWSHLNTQTTISSDDQIIVDHNEIVDGYRKYRCIKVVHPDQRTTVYMLIITRLQQRDMGIYRCRIFVRGAERHPTKDGELQVLVPPVLVYSQTSTTATVMEGGALNLTCNATGFPYPNITWVRGNGASLSIGKFSFRGTLLALHNIQKRDRGVYRCVCDNNVQPPATHDATLLVFFRPEAREVQDSYGQAQNRQFDLTIECRISGYPDPNLAWYYIEGDTKREITNDDKHDIQIMTSHGSGLDINELWYTLTIINIQANDYGRYECEGRNVLGTDSAFIQIYETSECQGANCPSEGASNLGGGAAQNNIAIATIVMLESNWKTIKDEGLANMDEKKGSFLPEEENLLDTGDWKQFTLFQQGRKNEKNCKRAPKTCALIDKVADAKGCKRGQVKFSIMSPGVHVWPHCGPTNCRIRAHLGLVIPPGPKIRVADDTREWIEGKFIMFDDSFEHEVWHEGSSYRLVLIVDFWHPELTEDQKYEITPI
ncbi:unnamed protein product [Owenia fusiformis]|uniref:Ig-like domain-containing protein n=1 Tax=Owenia fusiformis TaxID=6347 RepID=A0A8S4MXC6_OWEFU|nr:unnamed protein product [Owenia fusiformis]